MRCVVALVLLAGCGRLEFALRDDAPPPPQETGALTVEWARGFGSVATDQGLALAFDPAGNVILGGYLDDSASLGGAVLTGQPFTVFAASYEPSGAHRWSRAFGGGVVELGLASDSDGIYLSGGHSGTIDFGGGPYTTTSEKPFVAALDHEGGFRWSYRASGPYIMTTALDVASGIVVITGYGDGTTWNFGGANLLATSGGSFDQFAAGYRTSDGSHVWSRRIGSQFFTTYGDALAALPDGSTWIAGGTGGMPDYGSGPIAAGPGRQDGMLVRFDPTGTAVITRWLGGATGSERATAVALDPEGDVFVAGSLGMAADLGGGQITGSTFVARLDSSGQHRWSRGFTPAIDALVLARSPQFVYVAGLFAGDIDFGGVPLSSAGGLDIVIATLTPDGDVVWAERFGGTGDDEVSALRVAADGTVYVAGAFAADATFGPLTLTSTGDLDVLLAALRPVLGN